MVKLGTGQADMETLERLLGIATEWTSVIYNENKCEPFLKSHGFNGFSVWQDFVNQFADEPEDIELHRAFYREKVREQASRAYPVGQRVHPTSPLIYQSELHRAGRLALAKVAGFDDVESWIAKAHPTPIQMEPDPVLRAMARKLRPPGRGREVLDDYNETLKSEKLIAVEAESRRFSRGPTGYFLPKSRSRLIHDYCRRHLSPMGFDISQNGLDRYVTFDLEITGLYVLRFSIGDDNTRIFTLPVAQCTPMLHLARQPFRQRFSEASRSDFYLVIPFASLVEGITQVYRTVSNEVELELVIGIHVLVLKWLLPSLIACIKSNV